MSDPGAPSPPDPARNRCQVVGIGASAGGLAALEQFFERVPPRSGLAYIVVQHLDPTQKPLLAELLQRVTPMAVHEAAEGARMEADCVYVIPANAALSVVDGVLHLEPPGEPRGLRLPINLLFSSLARDQREQAVGVVLSGMGSDGTLGLQAIKVLGGLAVVQEPKSAQFASMPESAIAAQCADMVLAPWDMPARILSYLGKLHGGARLASVPGDRVPPGEPIAAILNLLRQYTHHDFSLYKPTTVLRRIERRMAIHSLPSSAAYASFLSKNPQEIDLLFKELLIGVTRFFRDTAVWEHLSAIALPGLLGRQPAHSALRAWVVGCSTGEEAYSLAMAFDEVARLQPPHLKCSLQIFASDLSPDAIALARRGLYPPAIASDVSPERLASYFSLESGQYRVHKTIRDMVMFAQQDVVLDPPFTKLDIVSCRNLMIYFESSLQRQLLPLFHYSLRPGGLLLLGTSETVGRLDRLFKPLEAKLRLYQRQDVPSEHAEILMNSFPPLLPAKATTENPAIPATPLFGHPDGAVQAAADHVLLQVHAPPAVVVNQAGDIIYFSGRTGKYLEPAAGKANWNFHAMARDSLRAPLAAALLRAHGQEQAVQLRGLQVPSGGGTQYVDVTVQALRDPGVLHDMTIIVFRDVRGPSAARKGRKPQVAADDGRQVEQQRYQDEIQALREANRASREELQSTNEELQSTNEELQSTNEELTTSKEEMQSMNEELQTVNSELQSKLDALSLAQSDMRNVLNSTEIAILFLDRNLNVRRFTENAAKIINLRDTDIGRPLGDLTSVLQYPGLQADTQATVATLKYSEKQIPADDGRWFTVRIMPYKRHDNVLDGAVITLVDITATKALEAKLRSDAKG